MDQDKLIGKFPENRSETSAQPFAQTAGGKLKTWNVGKAFHLTFAKYERSIQLLDQSGAPAGPGAATAATK
jgi:hypothetical protein